MAKPKLGTKRVCPSCGTKYYDLERSPIVCPSCGTVFEVAAVPQRAVKAAEPKPVVAEPTAEVERDEELVSLEEVEADTDADVGPDADSDEDAEPEIPDVDIEVDDDAAAETADTFLEDEEEEGANVSDLLDVEAEDETDR